jgi:predicted amidophosphoribosyltransferase
MRDCVVCGKLTLDEQAGLCVKCGAEVKLGYRCSNCLLWIGERGKACPRCMKSQP